MSEENQSRVPVNHQDAPDTADGSYRKQPDKSFEFWFQLTPKECADRATRAGTIASDNLIESARADEVLSAAKREVKRIAEQKAARADLMQRLQLEASEQRANEARPVDVYHHYPIGGNAREICIFGDKVVHSRLLRADEIDAQEDMMLSTPAATDEYRAVVENAIARELTDDIQKLADSSPKIKPGVLEAKILEYCAKKDLSEKAIRFRFQKELPAVESGAISDEIHKLVSSGKLAVDSSGRVAKYGVISE